MQTRVREEMSMRPNQHLLWHRVTDRRRPSSDPIGPQEGRIGRIGKKGKGQALRLNTAPVSAPHWGPDQQEPLRAQTTWIS
ncbi:unnamed protein product [Arctogadus glacialis]